MQVRFTRSARKHRIGRAHALYVISNAEPIRIADSHEFPERLLWIGVDDRGLELEIIGLEVEGMLLIIHVMPYRFRRQ